MDNMTEQELLAYQIAGELYGRLRSGLDGGRLTMAYEEGVGTVDYRWSIRKKRKEHTVNQCVDLLSLASTNEIDSLLDNMLSGLNNSMTQNAW